MVISTVVSRIAGEASRCKTFVDILQDRAAMQGDRVGYIFLRRGEIEADTLTYAELDVKAKAIASTLHQDSALSPGDRALLTFPPGLEFVAAFFGCLYAGVVPVPVYPPRRNQSLQRLSAIIADADASIVLTTQAIGESIMERFQDDAPDLTRLPIVLTDEVAVMGGMAMPISGSADDLAFLQYTSGSTGSPKGVMVSHSNLVHNSAAIYQAFNHSPKSCGVIWLPPYHDMGLIGGVLQPLYGGFPVYLMAPVDFLQKPFRWLQAISQYGATTSGGPNFGYELCLRRVTQEQLGQLDLSSWTVAFNGAEPIRWETFERFEAMFGTCGFRKEAFYPCYGMAETTLLVTGGRVDEVPTSLSLDRDQLEQNQVRVLTPRSGEEDSKVAQLVSSGFAQGKGSPTVMIVDPQTLSRSPEGTVGEIWVKNNSVALGYWQRSEETQHTFCNFIANEGPFLRTGDLGVLFAGELYVTGRIKDVIIIRGRNYYPQDLEHTVENCHGALKSGGGAVIAVERGADTQLVVIHEVDRKSLKTLDCEETIGAIRQAINAEYSLTVSAVFLLKPGVLPKTSSGKIKHYACRQLYQKKKLESIAQWVSPGQ